MGLGIMGRAQALNLAAHAFNVLMAREGTRWDSVALLKVIEEMNGRD
ncbi:MAG: hypothetical protein ABI619_07755 [Betaproteobacteria bacterium]